MVTGSIRVSFAGSWEEAQEYAERQPGITAPKGLANKGDDSGLPMLCWTFLNKQELIQGEATFEYLGWDQEFQCVQRHGNGF